MGIKKFVRVLIKSERARLNTPNEFHVLKSLAAASWSRAAPVALSRLTFGRRKKKSLPKYKRQTTSMLTKTLC